MCKIAYQASEDDGESFYTSQKPSTPAIRSRAGESACASDYINIPNGSNDEHGTGVCVIVSKFYNLQVFILLLTIFRTQPLILQCQILADFVEEDLTVIPTLQLILSFTPHLFHS